MKKTLLWLLLTTCVALAALPETSLYQLSSRWTNQQGTSMQLSQLQGQVRVMALIYTNCKGVCPGIVKQMKDVEGRLTDSQRSKVGFVLVSMDPEADTVARLQAYAKEQKFSPAWTLLRGNSEDIRELAATLDFRYRKSGAKDYAHTAMITVLDSQGDVAHQQVGFSGQEQVWQSILKLLSRP